MILGKVVGTIVTTISHRDYKNRRLFVVQPLGLPGEPPDESFIALDNTQAGIGERQPAKQARHRHILPGSDISSISNCNRK